mmetsp:Transcript_11653/g.29394  ORF Transcript_11653/g.29394 Transcript_11653/m.29394 type:complete len:235 (+) Transcript_11653:1081-1785(+)
MLHVGDRAGESVANLGVLSRSQESLQAHHPQPLGFLRASSHPLPAALLRLRQEVQDAPRALVREEGVFPRNRDCQRVLRWGSPLHHQLGEGDLGEEDGHDPHLRLRQRLRGELDARGSGAQGVLGHIESPPHLPRGHDPEGGVLAGLGAVPGAQRSKPAAAARTRGRGGAQPDDPPRLLKEAGLEEVRCHLEVGVRARGHERRGDHRPMLQGVDGGGRSEARVEDPSDQGAGSG